MAFISDRDKSDLKRRFRKDLREDVTISFFTTTPSALVIPGRDCGTCPQVQELLEGFVSLSPKLHLNIYDFFVEIDQRNCYGVDRIPAIVLDGAFKTKLRFYGIPSGYEYATLLEDVIILSRGTSPLMVSTRKKLRTVNKPVNIRVFVTPS